MFNPAREAHARLHEVWQLATNTSLAVLSLWLTWARNQTRLPNFLATLVTGGFLLAYVIRDWHGGSMALSDGSEKLLLGLNLGAFVFGVIFVLSLIGMLLPSKIP